MTIDLPARGDIRRILIVKWSALGDVVIASGVIEDIRRAFPGCEIDLNTAPPWDKLFAHDPRFRQVLCTDVRRSQRGLSGMLNWVRLMRRQRYDLIIDLQTNDRSRLLVALLVLSGAGVRYRLGNHPGFPYTLSPGRVPPGIHAFEHLRASLRAAGIPTVTPRPVLHPGPAHRARAAQLAAAHQLGPQRYALFMPGCHPTGLLKRWGAERYISLAMQLRDAGLIERVALIGTRDEMDECLRIREACGDWVANLCGQTEVLDIVPLAEGARLIVSNDTGTAHVASVAGRPMVVICGPTDPGRVKPVGDNVVTEQARIWCVGCYRKTCTHHSCMLLVSPEQVLARLRRLPGVPAPA